MGWTIHYAGNSPRTRAEVKREIEGMTTWETDDYTVNPVRVANHGSTWYVAARYAPKRPGAPLPADKRGDDFLIERDADGAYTIALVFLTSTKDREWGYKDMDEFCGPVADTCPESILKLLSRIEGEADSIKWARAWRARCREYAETRRKVAGFKVGDRIKLPAPVRFTDGHESDTFVVTYYTRRGRRRRAYISYEGGGMYRLGAGNLKGAAKVG